MQNINSSVLPYPGGGEGNEITQPAGILSVLHVLVPMVNVMGSVIINTKFIWSTKLAIK